jgi:hypothetical protein
MGDERNLPQQQHSQGMVEDKEQERSAKKRKNVAEVQNVSPFQPV